MCVSKEILETVMKAGIQSDIGLVLACRWVFQKQKASNYPSNSYSLSLNKINIGLNLNRTSTTDHCNEEKKSVLIPDLKICRLGDWLVARSCLYALGSSV